MKRTPKQYIDPVGFAESLKRCIANNEVDDELGEYFIKLTNNIMRSPSFINYSQDWKNCMISDALWLCLKYYRKWDSEKSASPFNYFSTLVFNAFKAFLNKQTKLKGKEISLDEYHNVINSDECNHLYEGEDRWE